jgi:hypothetical protein
MSFEGKPMTQTIASKKRSNRPITEFACKSLEKFVLDNFQDDYQITEKNTTIIAHRDGSLRVVFVLLYEEEILKLVIRNDKPVSLCLSFTSCYDSHGQPTTTTCERLNGLLDRLGTLGVIPQGVRVFRDSEYFTTYIGKENDKIAIGEDFYRSVYITPSPSKLIFAGYTSKITSAVEEFSK